MCDAAKRQGRGHCSKQRIPCRNRGAISTSPRHPAETGRPRKRDSLGTMLAPGTFFQKYPVFSRPPCKFALPVKRGATPRHRGDGLAAKKRFLYRDLHFRQVIHARCPAPLRWPPLRVAWCRTGFDYGAQDIPPRSSFCASTTCENPFVLLFVLLWLLKPDL